MRYTEFFQMIDTGFISSRILCSVLSKSQKLSFIFYSRIFCYRKIAHVHFINHDIGKALQFGTFIQFPSFRIRFLHIDDSCPFPVYPNCLCPHTGSFFQPDIIHFNLKGIKFTFQIFLNLNLPGTFFSPFHIFRSISHTFLSIVIKQELYLRCCRRPYPETGCMW